MTREPQSPGELPRRSFVGALLAAGTTCVSALLAIPLFRVALFPLRDQNAQTGWSDLGPLENFTQSAAPVTQSFTIEQRDGWRVASLQQTVHVVGAGPGQPLVLSSVCPHLGCTVRWQADKAHFACPCHTGTFAPDGSYISGPPARGMDELPVRIQDGRLYVQFQNFRQLVSTKEPVD
jgi:menaquinol-cytochrome c reductase iron-sulfur subunit